MDGGLRSRLVNEQLKSDYKKKVIFDVFRSKMQGYYSEMLNIFSSLIEQ